MKAAKIIAGKCLCCDGYRQLYPAPAGGLLCLDCQPVECRAELARTVPPVRAIMAGWPRKTARAVNPERIKTAEPCPECKSAMDIKPGVPGKELADTPVWVCLECGYSQPF